MSREIKFRPECNGEWVEFFPIPGSRGSLYVLIQRAVSVLAAQEISGLPRSPGGGLHLDERGSASSNLFKFNNLKARL